MCVFFQLSLLTYVWIIYRGYEKSNESSMICETEGIACGRCDEFRNRFWMLPLFKNKKMEYFFDHTFSGFGDLFMILKYIIFSL